MSNARKRLIIWLAAAVVPPIVIVAVVFLSRSSYPTFRVPSEGMAPTYRPGDVVLCERAPYRNGNPLVGEVVMFYPPAEALYSGRPSGRTVFLRRCAGVPGMVVEVRANHGGKLKLYRDGQPADEPYVGSPMEQEFKLVCLDPGALSAEDTDVVRSLWRGDLPDLISLQRDPGDTVFENVSANSKALGPIGKTLWKLPAAPLPPGYYLLLGDNRARSADSRYWGPVRRDAIVARAVRVLSRR